MIHPDRIAIIRLCVLCRGRADSVVQAWGGNQYVVYRSLRELSDQQFLKRINRGHYDVTSAGWAVLAYDERLDKPEIREWIHEES